MNDCVIILAVGRGYTLPASASAEEAMKQTSLTSVSVHVLVLRGIS